MPDQCRFQPSRLTLLFDRFMTGFIKIGGIIVVAAVMAIFVFILVQIIPLFQGAKVKELQSVQVPDGVYLAMGVDEWSELPFLVRADGTVLFIDTAGAGGITEVNPQITPAAEGAVGVSVTAANYRARQQQIIFGLSNGTVVTAPINYSTTFQDGKRQVTQNLKPGKPIPIGEPGVPVQAISAGESGGTTLVAAVQQTGDQASLHAVRLSRKKTMLGLGAEKVDRTFDLTPLLTGRPVQILVTSQADGIVVVNHNGAIEYFFRSGEEFQLRQTFKPFGDLEDPTIGSVDFLFGDVSLVVTSVSGENRIFSLRRDHQTNTRTFTQTKEFEPLPGAATFFNASLRNKAFLTGSGPVASLRYGTTEAVRWEETLPFTPQRGVISGKYDRMLFLDTESRLHLFSLQDPHPESSLKALFGKVWYEGYSEPEYLWQSTGGSDEFESKLSLVPLVVGTIKGTIYAMLFAVPIALLAALYTSQFLAPRYKGIIKPTMEIMASLPSVVLGFLAALWLAPLIDTRVPSILLMCLMVPLTAVGVGYFWSLLPIRYRLLIKPGYEFLVFLPLLLLALTAAWKLGPELEKWLFVVRNPETGTAVADFRLWWPAVTGTTFEQRNSLVVGFMMGFAVIPIIFTIAEDALSNVPTALRSGSLALGASRWQTAIRIVVPTASAGIFSALMIGLGRAVGETMIVLMATGNTPVMDLNIFSGMRTLSANIAVELPEAPHHSTLYRTLFLGAMLLFLMTFLVNTVAEVLRQHLRERYKTV